VPASLAGDPAAGPVAEAAGEIEFYLATETEDNMARGMSPEAVHLALEGDIGTTVQLTLLRRGKVERVALKRTPLASSGSR